MRRPGADGGVRRRGGRLAAVAAAEADEPQSL